MNPLPDPGPYIRAFADAPGRPKTSANAVKFWLRRFEAFMERYDAITPEALHDFHLSLRRAAYAPASVNKALGVVNTYLRHLRAFRPDLAIPDAETRSVLMPRLDVPTSVPAALSPAEITALATHGITGASVPIRRFLLLGLLTGARPGEVLAMTPEHYHGPSRGLYVYSKKTRHQRVIPVHDSVALRTFLGRENPGVGGSTPYCSGFTDYAWEIFTQKCLGKPLHRKVLRSTFASYAASSMRMTEFEYCSRTGHTTKVANTYYRSMIYGISGDTVEEWYGAAVALRELAAASASAVRQETEGGSGGSGPAAAASQALGG